MLTDILEHLARDTWERLRDSLSLQVRFGEETITDLILLELKRSHAPGIVVLQTNKTAESTQGTDWEWWVGSDDSGWLRFAVQAKKLDLITGRYGALGHKVGCEMQIDLLERFAHANQAIPLYCLFNFSPSVHESQSWQCCLESNIQQLGCTLAPASLMRHALMTRGCRTFEWIHGQPSALPWRCLLRCKRFQDLFDMSTSLDSRISLAIEAFGTSAHIYRCLPPEIRTAKDEGTWPESLVTLYSREGGPPPKHVVVIDRSQH